MFITFCVLECKQRTSLKQQRELVAYQAFGKGDRVDNCQINYL